MTDNRPRSDAAASVAPWRSKLHEIIFEADTPAGKAFDVGLLVAILLSMLAVSLETVAPIQRRYGDLLVAFEWTITILFTLEYALRLLCVGSPLRYAKSFFGIVDLLAILPTYLSVLLPGSQSLIVIRSLRLLRVFRVFKLAHFLSEAAALRRAVWEARGKIVVFLTTVLIAVSIAGSAMYLVENIERPSEQFTSISLFPERVARLHPKYDTPSVAIVIQSVWAIVLVLAGTYAQLVDYVVFADWIFFALAGASLFVFRRKVPLAERSKDVFATPGYPFIPGMFVAVAVLIVGSVLWTNPKGSALGLLILAAGVPAYWFWSGKLAKGGADDA